MLLIVIAAEAFLPRLKEKLVDERAANGLPPVELRLDERAAGIIEGVPAGAKLKVKLGKDKNSTTVVVA